MLTPSFAAKAEAMPCPRCHQAYAVRAPREGLLERVVAIAYYYPYRCQLCRHRFRALRWGVRYDHTERRRFERLPTQMSVSVIWGDRERTAVVSDVSVAGATVKTDEPIPMGQLVQLRLRPSGAEGEVKVDGSLVRSIRRGEVGLEFTEVSTEDERRLALMVRDLLEKLKRTP